MTQIASFAALGDSFTEGLDDPDGAGGYLGWADRVALDLAGRTPGFRYANLAVRGRLAGEIVAEQVPRALDLHADLVSVAGGTNDVLRRRCDPDAVGEAVAAAARRLSDAGARVILFTGTDPSRRLPWSRRLLPRITRINDVVADAARTIGATLVELFPEPVFDDPRLWSEDRLHLAAEGHRRVAAAVLEALGLPADPDWRRPLPPAPSPAWHHARLSDARWVRRHFGPWLHRRLTGRSSGDEVAPKRPVLERVAVP